MHAECTRKQNKAARKRLRVSWRERLKQPSVINGAFALGVITIAREKTST